MDTCAWTKKGLRLALAFVAVVQPAIAKADEATYKASEKPSLTYTVTGYLWASGLNGTESLFGLPTVDVDLNFSDLLNSLDFAAAGVIHVRRDRFGFLGELNYVKLSGGATGPGGIVTGSFETKSFFALAAVTYRAAEADWGNVDLIGGLKYFRLENTVALSPPPVTASDSENWVDVTIGAKGRFFLSPDWSVTTWAMVGAGGSDLSWDVLGAVDYQINPKWSVSVGYRATGVDYTSPQFSYDMVQSGPTLALTARF
ncbi:hypothetical protein ACFFUT_03575 [Pseudohalocynthiibacter aestuariivivens]|uniref:Porin family protein n=1 Tax=Pseudohalocynthiibacter aestuariivivens TaxID=1591409 RepID=A0ABV5JDS5_9RHOB|nr:hypothetical protein [Pseudohalocynthiibacter aestuariivivens]MBS9718845.1 hypothetical protein [Pseudohalocynthiibacter aestuariivivens]